MSCSRNSGNMRRMRAADEIPVTSIRDVHTTKREWKFMQYSYSTNKHYVSVMFLEWYSLEWIMKALRLGWKWMSLWIPHRDQKIEFFRIRVLGTTTTTPTWSINYFYVKFLMKSNSLTCEGSNNADYGDPSRKWATNSAPLGYMAKNGNRNKRMRNAHYLLQSTLDSNQGTVSKWINGVNSIQSPESITSNEITVANVISPLSKNVITIIFLSMFSNFQNIPLKFEHGRKAKMTTRQTRKYFSV